MSHVLSSRQVDLEVPPHGVLEARTALQIAIKGIRDVQDALDVLHTQRFLLVHREGLSSADRVLDLNRIC